MFKPIPRKPTQCLRRVFLRSNSTAAPSTPPLLARMRTDLKTAMKAKDTARLNVLRSIISQINQQSKTAQPLTTDLHILTLLRKQSSSLHTALDQYASAGRDDLRASAAAELALIDEYAGHVETVGAEEVEKAVKEAVESVREKGGSVNVGTVLKSLFEEGGALEGKPVVRGEVAKVVKELLK
ncbi:hypothetical protein AJ80_09596 [Polytolypa hystricis UAMH7299]|uniref:Altered inheritance of mitochondria protein 41 n=1 Tax=Polytolypa hystricis (strain UAMH7299) TaxID=1447883 RepID=A0A2B7WNG5_POLH7|nr:hypothetical protein AJ80_09596 [Polytolypa hystricis UAMH7299]